MSSTTADFIPSSEPPERLAQVLAGFKRNRLDQYRPYLWQRRFYDAGRENSERMLMAANATGKTMCGAIETALHLTGLYPDWWEGYRFRHPIKVWVGSLTNEGQRDTVQPILLGDDLYENLGTGFIPRRNIVGKVRTRQAGIPDIADSVAVRHVSGGLSHLYFKVYAAGWRLFMGGNPNVIWLDEEPSQYESREKGIFAECQTRVVRNSGILYVTYTPLLGETELTKHFMYPRYKGIWWIGATWEDAPHLDEERKEQLRKSYPDYQVETRTTGIPMMGEGRVFNVSEDNLVCLPFEIPRHFARIAGIDFGVHKDHPAAMAWLAWDRDTDIVYLYDVYKVVGETPTYHTEAWKRRGKWIPVSWPHDGLKKDPGSGKVLRDRYLESGMKMLSRSARYKNDVGGAQGQETIVMDVLERMKTGRFKVFSTCVDWLQEFRSYHRKDGRLVSHNDDCLKASFYAVMMLRYATPRMSEQPSTAGMPKAMSLRI